MIFLQRSFWMRRIDILLVGDSVGTNVLGYKDEREVSMADMLHHLGAVVRGAKVPGNGGYAL